MTKPRRDKDGFLADGPARLRRGIEEEKKEKLKAIVEKLSQEQDPEERKKLLQLYDEVVAASAEGIKKIKDYIF